MKLPNGYGSISKLSGKRRRPWVVRLTDSYSVTDGKITQSRKTLGYYETRSKALAALAEYNKKPYDIDVAGVTFAEIYELWVVGKKMSLQTAADGLVQCLTTQSRSITSHFAL